MGTIILSILLAILTYYVGKGTGEKETLEMVRDYINGSKNWDEVLSKLSKDWEEYDIEV